MSDEKPVPVKKFKKSDEPVEPALEDRSCIVHFEQTDDTQVRNLTETAYSSILKAVHVRQAQSNPSTRLDDICQNIPIQYEPTFQGYHAKCYAKFTNVSRLKIPTEGVEGKPAVNILESRASRRVPSSSESSGPLFPQDLCLFCGKGRKTKNRQVEPLSKCLTNDAQVNIKQAARDKEDFQMLGKIEGIDLIAKEAVYHGSCRREYVRGDDPRRTHSEINEETRKANKRNAYDEAFQYLSKYVADNIINDGVIVRMSMLKDKYLAYIQEHSPDHYNPNHKTCKLKDRLSSYFGNDIQFKLPHYGSELVFSSSLNLGETVEVAFDAISSEKKCWKKLL